MDIYREHLLDHYHHPRGWGLRHNAHVQERGFNVLCGDEITLQLFLVDDEVRAMYFEGKGCVLSQATASLLTEYVTGKTLADIVALTVDDATALIGAEIPPARLACVALPLKTIQLALVKES